MSKPTFNPELEAVARKLGEFNNWFLAYREKANPADDHIIEPLAEIETHLNEAVNNIARLVAIEFQQNTYFE